MNPTGWLGAVTWVGPGPGRSVTSGFGRIWRWSGADAGSSGLPDAIAAAPGDRATIETVLADPPGALEPGLCLSGPAGPVLALGRHPMRRYEPLRHEQWILQPDGDAWTPRWLFSEAADAAELTDLTGSPVGRWDKPGRFRRPIGKSDVFTVGGQILLPGLVHASRTAWGVRPVTGLEIRDAHGRVRARIAGDEPLGADLTRELPAWWLDEPSNVELALTVACLASVWDGCINTTE